MADAEKLAQMFAGFDSVWPGGFNRGTPATPQQLYDKYRKMSRLAVCVAQDCSDAGDDFIGYCDLDAAADETDTAYIPLLGAGPEHHGRGVGRELLREMIRRATQAGFRELTLYTWAGNLKAVPLYKKVGFFWEPDTSVFMRNFIPGLLASPFVRQFFQNRDWYSTLKRDLTVEPDTDLWNGIEVYRYRFEDGEDYLNVVFDRVCGGLTAVETRQFSVECVAHTPESGAVAGTTVPVRWCITRHTDEPLQVELTASGCDGIELSYMMEAPFDVAQRFELDRAVRITPDAGPISGGNRQRLIRTELKINGVELTLETGVKVVRPLEFRLENASALVGHSRKLLLHVTSNLAYDAEGALIVRSDAAIEGTGICTPLHLQAKSGQDIELNLRSETAGYTSLHLDWSLGSLTGSRALPLRVTGNRPVVSIDSVFDQQIVQETPGIRVVNELLGGVTEITSTTAGQGIKFSMSVPGPPFKGYRRRKILMSGSVDADGAATVSAVYPEMKDLRIERTITIISDNLARIDHVVTNSGMGPLDASLQLRMFRDDQLTLCLPTNRGLIREPGMDWVSFPMFEDDALADPKALAENWFAIETGSIVVGFIWAGDAKLETRWGYFLTADAGCIEPGISKQIEPIWAVVGSGDWRLVRGWWDRLIKADEAREIAPAEPQRVFRMTADESPILIGGDSNHVNLKIHNDRRLVLSGTVNLSGDGLDITPGTSPLDGVCFMHSPAEISVGLTPAAGYGAGKLNAEIVTPAYTIRESLPVVQVEAPGAVDIVHSDDEIYHVSNGVIGYRVAPNYIGSITHLTSHEQEFLHSSWPTPGTLAWANPWYGGIHPCIDWMGDAYTTKERFSASTVERIGASGRKWNGVSLACEFEHKDRKGLRVEVDYLTLPASDLLLVVSRWTNQTRGEKSLSGGLGVWAGVGGRVDNTVAYWASNGSMKHRRRAETGMETRVGSWMAFENPETASRLQVVVSGKDSEILLVDIGKQGAYAQNYLQTKLKAGATLTQFTWIVVNPAVSEFESYARLADFKSLP